MKARRAGRRSWRGTGSAYAALGPTSPRQGPAFRRALSSPRPPIPRLTDPATHRHRPIQLPVRHAHKIIVALDQSVAPVADHLMGDPQVVGEVYGVEHVPAVHVELVRHGALVV